MTTPQDPKKRARDADKTKEKGATTGQSMPLTPEDTHFPRNPAGTPGRGGTSATDSTVARQKETTNNPDATTVRGFTHTGVTGSTGGRADYGLGADQMEEQKKVTRAGDRRGEEEEED